MPLPTTLNLLSIAAPAFIDLQAFFWGQSKQPYPATSLQSSLATLSGPLWWEGAGMTGPLVGAGMARPHHNPVSPKPSPSTLSGQPHLLLLFKDLVQMPPPLPPALPALCLCCSQPPVPAAALLPNSEASLWPSHPSPPLSTLRPTFLLPDPV